MSWISGTISLDLQDIVRSPDPTACGMWLALETQFLGNAQTRPTTRRPASHARAG
jgi:hypothetical protein